MSVACGVSNPKSVLRKPETKAPAKETKAEGTAAKPAKTAKTTKK